MAIIPGITLFKISMSNNQPKSTRPPMRITAAPATREKDSEPVKVRGRHWHAHGLVRANARAIARRITKTGSPDPRTERHYPEPARPQRPTPGRTRASRSTGGHAGLRFHRTQSCCPRGTIPIKTWTASVVRLARLPMRRSLAGRSVMAMSMRQSPLSHGRHAELAVLRP